ncbi:hypothetical protein IW262DRAFT_1299675 [Armillaria fumosa]|nr:hypothetical protein IW262DRAFT_1299675 [Armillaria fumosa]
MRIFQDIGVRKAVAIQDDSSIFVCSVATKCWLLSRIAHHLHSGFLCFPPFILTTVQLAGSVRMRIKSRITRGDNEMGRTRRRDRGCTIRVRLWSSWAVEGEGKKVYFAGDTGYRSVKDGEDEEGRPVCPAFKEIGEHFSGFDLAMIPIGAYESRWFMSTIHCAQQDSVRTFQDIRAKKADVMHRGTWILTTEEVTEPPKRLAEECQKNGINDGDFLVSDIGETKYF